MPLTRHRVLEKMYWQIREAEHTAKEHKDAARIPSDLAVQGYLIYANGMAEALDEDERKEFSGQFPAIAYALCRMDIRPDALEELGQELEALKYALQAGVFMEPEEQEREERMQRLLEKVARNSAGRR